MKTLFAAKFAQGSQAIEGTLTIRTKIRVTSDVSVLII